MERCGRRRAPIAFVAAVAVARRRTNRVAISHPGQALPVGPIHHRGHPAAPELGTSDAVLATRAHPRGNVLVQPDAGMKTIAHGDREPRGIATDGKRAFVSIRGGSRVLVFQT
jgi:hypothetical protein